MIITKDFVWLHFPKCAGTKIELLFRKYLSQIPGIEQDVVTVEQDPEIKWHDSIEMRGARNPEFQLDRRTVICSFRKLPSWLESRYSFEALRSPDLGHSPELLLRGQFLEQSGFLNTADFYCDKYLPESLLTTAQIKFIRTEYFEMDFKHVFGQYLDLRKIPETEFPTKVNTTSSKVPRNISKRLHSVAREVYNSCPRWERIEKLAYSL